MFGGGIGQLWGLEGRYSWRGRGIFRGEKVKGTRKRGKRFKKKQDRQRLGHWVGIEASKRRVRNHAKEPAHDNFMP